MTRFVVYNRDTESGGPAALVVAARSSTDSCFGSALPLSLDSSTRAPIPTTVSDGADHAVQATTRLNLLSPVNPPRSWSPARPACVLPALKVTMRSQRNILPAGPSAASSASSERESTPQSSTGTALNVLRRRPQTKIACTSCRRKKSKCGGQRPVCSLCASMDRTRCEYDAGPDITRFAALKIKHEELQRRVTLFEELFRLLSICSEAESVEIIHRMRTVNIETDLEDLVKFIKNANLLMQLASA
ncbi:Putative zn(2)Cys(6) fungal-type DNA-binding domain-containing protein [Colletotrichum destructivum]|uniref:Zn(2)Cys(6) fungal-type DNA-binding domain-containing protein n=1 Tax=Colletotrichum destructivum TaxID=34406 RepID=A0AAX4J4H2_9PEZI|nr:Putative zn(2)Cys(6) fungal-type DNA-binding domain-containing protein [Colletotrichum destructivum]